MRYDAYLRSPEWGVLRRLAVTAAHHRCQVCNSEGLLNVHHRTYERVGREHLADVVVLCRACHALFHGVSEVAEVAPYDGPPLTLSPVEEARQQHIAAECFGSSMELAA